MKLLKHALGTWLPETGSGGDPIVDLRMQWNDIVGADVAAHSRPAEIERGALLVVTRSSAWSQQLSFLSERIVAAVRERTGRDVDRLRFRVGRVHEVQGAVRPHRARRKLGPAIARERPPSLEAALAQFKEDVAQARRSKAAAGWKECSRCGADVAPQSGSLCMPCVNATESERTAALARMLFEIPFLGFEGISDHIEGLTRREYNRVRRQLLARWWDVLTQLRRSGRTRASTREREIASSYVLLKSELDPERIGPEVVRDLLGEELHHIFYDSENS